MPGTLFVVATPIGNLEDITARALRVLREVVAHRRRRHAAHRASARALRHHDADDQPSRAQRSSEKRRRSSRGCSAARASRSSPTRARRRSPIPGSRLIRAAIDAGIRVEPIPGPSAVAGGAGGVWASDARRSRSWDFLRLGQKTEKRGSSGSRSVGGTVVFFEAPHRIRRHAGANFSAVVGDCQVVVGRELTKVHEELVRGPISEVLERLGEPRGEFTVVVRYWS